MKSKIVAIGIIISLMLLVLPAVASDYTLGIYGNANEDDTINMQDVTYTELIILEYKEATDLADAMYDSEIDILDVTQIELIILGQEKELTLIDTAGRVVTVKKPLNRLVTLFLHPVETLRSLKVPIEEVIAGMGYTDNEFFPELSEVPTVGTAFQPDIEAILELQPDAVIVHARRGGGFGIFDEVQNACEAAGITVLCLNFNQPDIYLEEVEKLGYLFGKRERAEELCNFYDNIDNLIAEKVETVSEENRPKVYYESRTLYESVAGINSCIDSTGGIDIFPEGGPVDIEALIAQDPDVIVKVVSYSDREAGGYHLNADDTAGMDAIREQIMNRPELLELNAVEEGRVHIISTEICGFYSNSCRHFLQIAYQAKWFHPELFEDLDPKALHQEYLTRFQGLDIDLDEKGVFVYPPLEESG